MLRRSLNIAISARLALLTGFYLAGLAAVLAVLALLERAGLPEPIIAVTLIGFVLATYAGAGVVTRTMKSGEFTEANRRLPPDLAGAAAAADWLPGLVFVVLIGGFVLDGGDGLVWMSGWIGGLMLMLVLVIPGLRRSGAASVSDYLAGRFGGQAGRFAGLVVLFATALLFLVAEVELIGRVAADLFGLAPDLGMWIALAALVVCTAFGGMRAVVAANATQYWLILAALLLTAGLLSAGLTGHAIPHLSLGQALAAVTSTAAGASSVAPVTDRFNSIALLTVLIAGTAVLPHMAGRYLATSGVGAARRAVSWSLFFLVLLLITVPVYAALARWQLQSVLVGIGPESVPAWLFDYGARGLVKICGADASSRAAVSAACLTAGGSGTIGPTQIWFDPMVVAVAAPRAAGFPFVVAALVAASALTAAMATVNGLLLALANAVGNDLFRGLFGQRASAGRRLLIARIAVIAAAAFAAWAAEHSGVPPLALLAWTFNLAAAGLFPALVLGIWWPKAGRFGVLAGMVAGFGLTLFYIVKTQFGGMAPWGFLGLTHDGIANQAAAIFGLPVGFAVAVLVSLALDARLAANRPGSASGADAAAASANG